MPPAEEVRGRAVSWMIAAGSAIGFAFLTKMAQGLLVLPAFGLVYLIASPLRIRARIGHLLAAAGSMIVSAGWFIALVELWPAAARPYIGGSTNNSLWELALGYNGLSRILGGAGGGVGGGGGGGAGGGNTSFGGATGILRMFGTAFGSQISWFIPAALLALVAGLVISGRAPRVDKARASLIIWGGWLVASMLVFSFMSGTIHPYYSVALAPAIGALVGIGATMLWRRRDRSSGPRRAGDHDRWHCGLGLRPDESGRRRLADLAGLDDAHRRRARRDHDRDRLRATEEVRWWPGP